MTTSSPQIALQERLKQLSEAELQKRIIEPLLRASGYETVRDVSGPNERGRDLIAFKKELGGSLLYAFQIKKYQLTGKVSNPKSLPAVLVQLRQAITEKIFDPATKSERSPDRVLLITPYEINQRTFEDAVDELQGVPSRQIGLIDGPLLADEVIKYIPEIAATLQDDIGYRLQVVAEHNRIPESIAFGRRSELELGQIFVETDYACFDLVLEFLKRIPQLTMDKQESTDRKALLRDEELAALYVLPSSWTKNGQSNSPATETTDLSGFLIRLNEHTTWLLDRVSAFFESDATDPEIDNLRIDLSSYQSSFVPALRLAIFKLPWDLSADDLALLKSLGEALTNRRRLGTYRHLLRMTGLTVITGPAGAGKSTLLRKLILEFAASDESIKPIFVKAIDLKEPGVRGFIKHVCDPANSGRLKINEEQFTAQAQAGKLRFLIDGLDEAGDLYRSVAVTVTQLAEVFPKCRLIITCRDGVDLSMVSSAFYVRLCPFSETQFDEFVGKWFSARPSAAAELRLRLQDSSAVNIREIATLPIIAALLCSLFEAEVELPISESELYESRLDLLLGRWEQAKKIPPMRIDSRQRYLQFLMQLALDVHTQNQREFNHQTVSEHASRFYAKGYNTSVPSFINDCISRGLIVREINGLFSFGHLTYQEFLVGKYLSHHNPLDQIIEKLGDLWWKKALFFYAALQGDISPLIIESRRHTLSRDQSHILAKMRLLANLTPSRNI